MPTTTPISRRVPRAHLIDETRWHRRRELAISWVTLAATTSLAGVAAVHQGRELHGQIAATHWGAVAIHVLALSIIGWLVYGSFVYQISRLGYLRRRRRRPGAAAGAGDLFRSERAALTVLVPSYREDPEVVTQTLLSAALQEYPSRQVVLLVDDPPAPTTPDAAGQLLRARLLPVRLDARLAAARRPFTAASERFDERRGRGALDLRAETVRVARLWRRVARELDEMAARRPVRDHTDRLFVDQVLRDRAERHRDHAERLLRLVGNRGTLDEAAIEREHRRLCSTFDARVVAFERKRYENLSHAPNKAMNLNSYLGLIGGDYAERVHPDGRHLEPCAPEDADVRVPATDYVLTVDADSILLPEYAATLVHELERPGRERVAVAQTPYSAVPGAHASVERIAGATTDIQYLLHQGFTAHDSTYWVGANALVRYAALRDIAEADEERGYPITRFIHDRTVIEDTESSVDLVGAGWQLYNHPERLAFSATPADFGALVVQRRRWANGGLIILPKLVRHLHRRRARPLEALLRVHYLASIAAVNVGLLALFALPVGEMLTPLLPLIALPYFVLYGRDLVLCGYRATDLVRVYALNLLLLPVNLAGVVGSMRQAVTGRPIPFRRTPKLSDRTTVPAIIVLANYALALWWSFGAAISAAHGSEVTATIGAANAALLVGGIGHFIGHRAGWSDLWATRRRRPPMSAAI